MTRVLVTGATGTLGTELLAQFHEEGYTVRIASRSTAPSSLPSDLEWARIDLTDGTGLRAAVAGVDVVVHAATSPPNERPYLKPAAVDVDGTERLLERCEAAGVGRFVYPSIVGIDAVPYSYYGHKLRAERLVEDAAVQSVVVRATQFHEFLDQLFRPLRWSPVWALPTGFRYQPVTAGEAATEISRYVSGTVPADRPEIGGPEVLTLGELASAWTDALDVRRPTVGLPLPGETAGALREGALTTPENRQGSTTWEEWLEGDRRAGTEGLATVVGDDA